jgi:hypothetical protein
MSTTGSNQTTRPVSNFTSIFDAALEEYKRLTGKNLHTHPFATAFDVCSTPETILDVFRRQARAFDAFHQGDDKLMIWLNPTVHVLFTLSATLGEGIGLVSLSFLYCVCSNALSLAIFTRQDDFYWHRCSSRCESSLTCLTCICMTFGPGGERCRREL